MLVARYVLTASLFGVFSMGIAVPAYAQFDLPNYNIPGIENSVLLRMNPMHPQPGDRVQVSAQSVFLDLSRMNITWTVNNKVIGQGVGMVDIDLTMGALGSEMKIVLSATSDTTTASKQLTIIPTQIDVLFESDSYVPPFYRGRALPSEQTYVRVQAIPRFKRADGSFVPKNSMIYTWKQNGSIVAAVSGKGKYAVTLPSPVLFGADTISVEAVSVDGIMSGSASISIPSVTPILLLYQDHPLFGRMYHRALGVRTAIPESEMMFMAVPFFSGVATPNDTSLQYGWNINNEYIVADTLKRNEITINAAKSAAQALIHLDLTQTENPIFSLSGEWGISFSARDANEDGFGQNPFLPQ